MPKFAKFTGKGIEIILSINNGRKKGSQEQWQAKWLPETHPLGLFAFSEI